MLEIKNLTKRYGTKIAVDNLSLTIEDGDLYGFIGKNGAGKTTAIKAVVGIHSFDAGEILIDGLSIKAHAIECKQRIAYIPDNPDIYDFMKGEAYLNFVADMFDVPAGERTQLISEYAKAFEIYGDLSSMIGSYSHGMKQKLVIISALIHKPKLLVLDEPFVGLDPKSAFTLREYFKDMTKKGASIFFSSHNLEVVQKLCNKTAIIKDGRLIANGPTETITADKSLESVFLELTEA